MLIFFQSKYILEITLYQAIGPGLFPLSETLREIGRTFLFSCESGVGLERIDDLDRVKRGGYLHHSCAGIFITECRLPSNPGEICFFISPGHPKEPCCSRGLDDGYKNWRALAFEEGADDKPECLKLDHIGPSSYLIYNFRATNVSSWAKLFAQTAHVLHPTDETRENPVAVLLGSPEVLWGLVALGVGDDIDNLGAYVTFGERGIKLAWRPGSQPDSLYSTITQD